VGEQIVEHGFAGCEDVLQLGDAVLLVDGLVVGDMAVWPAAGERQGLFTAQDAFEELGGAGDGFPELPGGTRFGRARHGEKVTGSPQAELHRHGYGGAGAESGARTGMDREAGGKVARLRLEATDARRTAGRMC
jgi:hypothetical protein